MLELGLVDGNTIRISLPSVAATDCLDTSRSVLVTWSQDAPSSSSAKWISFHVRPRISPMRREQAKAKFMATYSASKSQRLRALAMVIGSQTGLVVNFTHPFFQNIGFRQNGIFKWILSD